MKRFISVALGASTSPTPLYAALKPGVEALFHDPATLAGKPLHVLLLAEALKQGPVVLYSTGRVHAGLQRSKRISSPRRRISSRP